MQDLESEYIIANRVSEKNQSKLKKDLRKIMPSTLNIFPRSFHAFNTSANSQLGEIFNSCVGPSRILGPLPNRYGVQATVHGALNNWNLKARKTGGTEYSAMLNPSSPASCVLAFFEKQDPIIVPNVTRFCSFAEAHPTHAPCVEIFC